MSSPSSPASTPVSPNRGLWANSLTWFTQHPVFTLLTGGGGFSLLAVIGLMVALYTLESWQLRAYIQEPRAVIVDKSEVDDLKVVYRGAEVSQTACVAQVQLWNNGNTIITSDVENVYVPITVTLRDVESGPRNRILSARIIKQTRPEVVKAKAIFDFQPIDNFLLPHDDFCTLTWLRLEPGDGFVVQLIYSGKPDAPLEVTGIVKKQGTVALSRRRPAQVGWSLMVPAIAIVMYICLTAFAVYRQRRRHQLAVEQATWKESDGVLSDETRKMVKEVTDRVVRDSGARYSKEFRRQLIGMIISILVMIVFVIIDGFFATGYFVSRYPF